MLVSLIGLFCYVLVCIRIVSFLHFELCFADSGEAGSDAESIENSEENKERRKGERKK